ncbi:EAL domain-containing protein [Thioalkalivibrio sp.]|uniref:bifunctional diguanylate cyclase/phosphodiesterase n=1 Tax=Thioalkalivibrio sp. TaxID=2093813 RepID=UPI0039763089
MIARNDAGQGSPGLSRLCATLSEAHQVMVRARDCDELFAAISRIAVDSGGFRGCTIAFIDADSGRLQVAAQHGLDPETTAAMPPAMDVDALLAAMPPAPSDRAHHRGNRATPDPNPAWCEWAATAGIPAFAHYPLHEHGRLIGACSLFGNDRDAFSTESVHLLHVMMQDLSHALGHLARERALQESEARYRRIFETTQEGIWALDTSHRIIEVNAALAGILGYSPGEMLGRSIGTFVFPEDLADQQEHLRRRERGEAETYERRLRRSDGSEVFCMISGTPVLDPEGRFKGSFAMFTDITARKRADAALRLSEQRFRGLFEEVANIAVQAYDQDRRVIFWNGASEALYGYSRQEAMGQRVEDLIIPTGMHAALQELTPENILAGADIPQGEMVLRRKDGTPVTVFTNVVLRTNSAGQPEIYTLDVDLTQLRQVEERLRQSAKAFESAAEGVIITDANARILYVNRAFTTITGYSEDEVLGKNPSLLSSGRQDRAFYEAMWATIEETGLWQGEIWNRRKNGEVYPGWLTINSVHDENGRVSNYVAVFSDVTALLRSQQERDFLAYHDPLTALPNRELLRDRMQHALERAQRGGGGIAVLLLDIDRFKNVNDSLGHDAGDALLQDLARRLANALRGGDTLARLGGDEFLIVLEEHSGIPAVDPIVSRLAGVFDRPFLCAGQTLFITASIGASVSPADGGDPETLIRNAELAMYQAKGGGRNTLEFYRQEMASESLDRLNLENALRGALTRGEFRLHFQPQVNLTTGELAGVEALLRWQHPSRGLLLPGTFIPVAEEMGIIGDIGDWVLTEACRQMVAWHASGPRIPRVAVNLSVQQLERGALASRIGQLLEDYRLPAAELELEVTESMIMRQAERAIATLRELRALGVGVSVDDFGTGYSSLGYLRRLPLNRLKIDRSFVTDIGQDKEAAMIARAIIGLGSSLGYEVVAEGIETAEQAAFLRTEGCQIGQGYLFGRPVSPEALATAWT